MNNKKDVNKPNKFRVIIAYALVLIGLGLIIYAIIEKYTTIGVVGAIVLLIGAVYIYVGKYGLDKGMEELVKVGNAHDLALEKQKAKQFAKGIKEGLNDEEKDD